jgi:hypothetical protein
MKNEVGVVEAKVQKEREVAVESGIIEGIQKLKIKIFIPVCILQNFLPVNPRRTNHMLKRRTPKKVLR